MKSILTIGYDNIILTVVYDHETGKFSPDVEHDEDFLCRIDTAIEKRRPEGLPKNRSITGIWCDNLLTPDDKLRYLSFLCQVRVDICDDGSVKFVKDWYMRHKPEPEVGA